MKNYPVCNELRKDEQILMLFSHHTQAKYVCFYAEFFSSYLNKTKHAYVHNVIKDQSVLNIRLI